MGERPWFCAFDQGWFTDAQAVRVHGIRTEYACPRCGGVLLWMSEGRPDSPQSEPPPSGLGTPDNSPTLGPVSGGSA